MAAGALAMVGRKTLSHVLVLLVGTGWGISGLCPGPGFADLAINPLPALAFVAALLAGMIAHRVTS